MRQTHPTTRRSARFALLLALVSACGAESGKPPGDGAGAGGSGGTGGQRDAGSAGRDAGPGPADGGADAGLMSTDGGQDAAEPLPSPTGITVVSGGDFGTSPRFNLQVGIGTPIPVTQGAGQSHRLSLGSPVLVPGPGRR